MTPGEGRAFAFPVGAAFLVLAAILWWRDHVVLTQIFGGMGAVLLAAGVMAPTWLGPLQRSWMGLAHAISKVTTPIVMAIVYFLVVTPIAVLRRALGGNPVEHASRGGSYWHTRPEERRRADLHRQF